MAEKPIYLRVMAYPEGIMDVSSHEGRKLMIWEGTDWQLPTGDMVLTPIEANDLDPSEPIQAFYSFYEGCYVDAFGRVIRSEKWGTSSHYRFKILKHHDRYFAAEYRLLPNKEEELLHYSILPDSSQRTVLKFLSTLHHREIKN